VDRGRCIGVGNCITLAPTAFDWVKGDLMKSDVIDLTSIDEERLREAILACPTQAITVEEVEELLPWQLRGSVGDSSQRVVKTFMFTDIVGSTTLAEALGDEAWEALLRWHDETLTALFAAHHGANPSTRGDGFLVTFESPDAALACAVAIQRKLADHRAAHGFAPQVRIGVHASDATQVGHDFMGIGVHEAARIAQLGGAGEIVASQETVTGTRYRVTSPRTVSLKGIGQPVAVVTVEWR
jgi:class 3 adenylate cyclase